MSSLVFCKLLFSAVVCKADLLFKVRTNPNGIQSLKRIRDELNTEFIMEGKTFGEVIVRYWLEGDGWKTASSFEDKSEPASTPSFHRNISIDVHLRAMKTKMGITLFEKTCMFDEGLSLVNGFSLTDGSMLWSIRLKNAGSQVVEIGDIELPLPMNTKYPKHDTKETLERRVFKHSHISGHGSFVFWMPAGGKGSYLVMTPMDDTKLEFFTKTKSDYAHGGGDYHVFIHSAIKGGSEKRGTWRQDHTSVKIAPGKEVSYGFKFDWANGYDGVRDVLYRNGGFDVRVVPGMVVPEDLFAMFSLRTKNKITQVVPEFQDKTKIEYLGEKGEDIYVYKVTFFRLGENKLTVKYGNSKYMILEFFVTQPLETLIKKRAAFIANYQQHRVPSKWYDGLFSLWDVRLPEGHNLLGPDNRNGQAPYAVSGSDDPSNSKCIYLAEKNVAYPAQKEIEALEYFLENFVWGKHQRTDQEIPYPYGIYGCDSWKDNRFSNEDPYSEQVSRPRPRGDSQCHIWRTFDYPTYFALYYDMYLIAKQNPGMVQYLDAAGYLERAFRTAKAFFEVPYNIRMEGGWAFTGWCDWAYKLGNFHEKYILNIIDALEEEGEQQKADYLRGEWEKKVKYFLYDERYPFASEMPIDSTAYESSYAIAKYALTHKLKPDEKLWQDKNTGKWYSHPRIDPNVHKDFMWRQLVANLACRGWLETSYYHYGSDFRGQGSSGYTMSYMSQMGGWSVLDYALYFAEKPTDYVRLGYGSLLCSWGLMNTGTEESNYGYWSPGKRHDGAVGWGFQPVKYGRTWNPGFREWKRGAWPVCGEIDHGLTAGVEAATTVVIDDPIFGLFAYGGVLERKQGTIHVIPCDGVRQSFHFLKGDIRFHMSLDRDGFAKEQPIICKEDLSEIVFTSENRGTNKHFTRLSIQGLPTGTYAISVDGKKDQTAEVDVKTEAVLKLPVSAESETMTIFIKRTKGD